MKWKEIKIALIIYKNNQIQNLATVLATHKQRET